MEVPIIPIARSGLAKAALLIAVLSVNGETLGAEDVGTKGLGAESSVHRSSTAPSRTRLLTAREGRALVNAALQQPIESEKPDCSHLIYQILNDAGLTYPYATSSAIFAGVPQFRRVHYAQAGDLIVWRGHVGLVVDPKRTTFFSSTDSGLRTDEYTSDYWRHRGYHRFYRYIVTHATMVAAHRLTEEHVVRPNHHAEARASLETPRAQETLSGSESSFEAASKASSEAAAAAETSPDDPPVSSPYHDFPETIPIDTENRRPTKNDLEQAISELTNASTAALQVENGTSMPVVFVRSWKVEKIKLNGDQGWVEVRIEPSGERNADGTWKKSRVRKLHCDLRRDQNGWLLLVPRDRLYVSAQSR